MSHSHQTTNFHDHVPFHKLTEVQAKAWCFRGPVGDSIRRGMCSQLARMYPSGVGVCSPTCKLVAYVQPSGAVRLLVAPFRLIPIWKMANQPRQRDCPCQEFWDPEVRGPWRNRGLEAHHPFCQYLKESQRVFVEVYRRKNGGVVIDEQGKAQREHQKAARVRPDLMLKVQREVGG